MNEATQEGAGRDDDSASGKFAAIDQSDTYDAAIGDDQLVGLALDRTEIGCLADRGLHCHGIELAIGLGAWTADRRALAPVKHAKLNTRRIGDAPHQAVQRIDLAYQMTLTESSDGGVAGHRTDGRKAMSDERCPGARPRGYTCGLTAGMTSADDDDVK